MTNYTANDNNACNNGQNTYHDANDAYNAANPRQGGRRLATAGSVCGIIALCFWV